MTNTSASTEWITKELILEQLDKLPQESLSAIQLALLVKSTDELATVLVRFIKSQAQEYIIRSLVTFSVTSIAGAIRQQFQDFEDTWKNARNN